MEFQVNRIVPGKQFAIDGLSYIGKPQSNTAMFITKKVDRLLPSLNNVDECLVFAEAGITIPQDLLDKHAFSISEYPQLAYSRFANQFALKQFEEEKEIKFILYPGGYYVSEDVELPQDTYIEPGCVIGPRVQIGHNARILSGTVIRHASIGNDFLSNENAVIGANGFTMVEDEEGNLQRMPTLGKVIIGNNVEIGTHDNISRGSSGNTIIEDNVKLDSLVYIGHDAYLHKNVQITAGVIVGGFSELREHSYVGMNASLRNRISVGENVIIGMGSTVTKSFEPNVTAVGNPAKVFNKNSQ